MAFNVLHLPPLTNFLLYYPLPQTSSKDWRMIQRRYTNSGALLNVALLRSAPDASTAAPPSRMWQFLYYHTPLVQYRNWLGGKGASWPCYGSEFETPGFWVTLVASIPGLLIVSSGFCATPLRCTCFKVVSSLRFTYFCADRVICSVFGAASSPPSCVPSL